MAHNEGLGKLPLLNRDVNCAGCACKAAVKCSKTIFPVKGAVAGFVIRNQW